MVDKNLALLVEELKKDGVEKGQQEAEKIIADAKKEAEKIIAKAKQDAAEEMSRAKNEADKVTRTAASGAKQAGISLITSLKKSIDDLLQSSLGTIVKEGLSNQALVEKMLVSFAQGLKPGSAAAVTVSDAVDVEKLTRAVFAAAGKEIGSGLEIKSAPSFPGISVQLQGETVKYELTEKLLREMIGPFLSESAKTRLFP